MKERFSTPFYQPNLLRSDDSVVVAARTMSWHRGDTPPPALSPEDFLRLEAHRELESMAPAPLSAPDENACWELWFVVGFRQGFPCLHPDGRGHVGPHGPR